MFRFWFLSLLLLLLFQSPAPAEIYKWVSANGTITFRDTPPPEGVEATTVTTAPLNVVQTPESVSSLKPGRLPATEQPVRSVRGEVELFTTSWCGYCRQARSWLQQHGVSYRDYDIEQDQAAAWRQQQLGGGNGVPFALINGRRISGFSPDTYAAALGIR